MLERFLEEGRPLVAVHRGKNGASVAENTVFSALTAFDEGADIVEFDVLRTLDNKVMRTWTSASFFPPGRSDSP